MNEPITFNDCTITGATISKTTAKAFAALAKATEANARAIHAIADAMERAADPAHTVHIGDSK